MSRKRSLVRIMPAAVAVAALATGATLGAAAPAEHSNGKGPSGHDGLLVNMKAGKGKGKPDKGKHHKGKPDKGKKTSFIQGRVTSENGREAGVWVIAETDDLPTPYRKIVVTNKQGRYVLPDLPQAEYEVWVRGYGLSDSERTSVQARRKGQGRPVNLTAEVADTPQEAAAIYPANYWLSLFEPPEDTESLPGGRSADLWMADFKMSCQLCHQMGATRTRGLGGDREALDIGLQKARSMNGPANGFGRDALLDQLADWGAKNAAGRTPPQPPRPQGIERNFVITQLAWGDLYTYAHDEVATDKRNPYLYPNGKVWGVDLGNDRLLSVDPKTNEAEEIPVPTLPGHETPWCDQPGFATLGCPVEGIETPHLGAYDNPANPHNPMMDETGKVWMTTQIRPGGADSELPEFCSTPPGPNAEHRSPPTLSSSGGRQLGYYDTKTEEFELIDTCTGTHHLQFDQDGVLWLSGDSQEIGWFDPSKFDPEQPETAQDAHGWSGVVVDSDGDGVADTPSGGFNYGIIPNPVDGSVWTGRLSGGRGDIQRYDPETQTHEVYSPPAPGHGPRGVDADTEGNIWVGLGGSGHLAKFERDKCAQTWGTGDQCPEGWTLYRSPGPGIETDEGEVNADFHYYVWVDQFNTLGLGKDTPILNGTGSDSLLAFDQETEEFTVIRVPYPLNVFTRGLDGRIDDRKGGWKGRGLWFDNGADPVLHSEIPQSYAAQVQLRPNPLAR